jgi:transcriptional regulator PpsR
VADHIEVLPGGFVVLDADGVIVEANRAFLDMVQEEADGTIKGQHIGRWLDRPGGDEKMFLSSLRANGRVQRFHASIAGSLGARVDAEITAVINASGARGLIWACVHDVSRRLDGAGQPAREHAQLGTLLISLMEQVGKTGLKSLVNMAVGLMERYYITQALQLTAGNRTAAARLLGLSRQSLYVKLARYDIEGADGCEGLDVPNQAEP